MKKSNTFANVLGIILIIISLVFGILSNAKGISYILLIFSGLIFVYFSLFVSPWNGKSNGYLKFMYEFIDIFKITILFIFLTLYVISIIGYENSRYLLFLLSGEFVFLGIIGLYFISKISKSEDERIFRIGERKDIDAISQIYSDGANALKEDGVDQWQGVYLPTLEIDKFIEKDLFVLEIKGEIVATACLIEGIDEDYENIEGMWHTKSPYISIHKFATSNKFKRQGYGRLLMDEIYEYAKNKKMDLRIDTHEDNLKMIKFIKSCGYSYCGIVYLNGGKLKRFAYDRKYREEVENSDKKEYLINTSRDMSALPK